MITINLERLRFLDANMSGSNIEHGIVRDVPYVILMRMGNGEVIEIMTIGSTSVEECGGRDFVVVRLISPKITTTHWECLIFEDMLLLEDGQEPCTRRTL